MSGKTIEVLNTDAEAASSSPTASTSQATRRHASRRRRTLTGAIVVALANINVGVFGSDSLHRQASRQREMRRRKNVAMPVDDDYRDFIKGTVPISRTSAAARGGAITGACSSRNYGDTPGFTWTSPAPHGTTSQALACQRPTGVALRTLVT